MISNSHFPDEQLTDPEIAALYNGINVQADRQIERLLAVMFLFGVFIAFFYDTWLVAFGIGGLNVIAYFFTKRFLYQSDLYHYVFSAVSAVFAAQYIYQMHGMAEMHFWVFICSGMLVIYQNWKLQLPLIILVIVHHATFAYLQYAGYKNLYFTQLDYMDLTTFVFHGVLAAGMCMVSGIWSDAFRKQTFRDALNLKILSQVKGDIEAKNEELRASEEELMASGEELKQINENLNDLVEFRTQTILNQNKKFVQYAFLNAHKVRSPLARILGLVNLLKREEQLNAHQEEMIQHLSGAAKELDVILTEVRINLDEAEFQGLDNASKIAK